MDELDRTPYLIKTMPAVITLIEMGLYLIEQLRLHIFFQIIGEMLEYTRAAPTRSVDRDVWILPVIV